VLEGFNGSVRVTADQSVSGVTGRAVVDWHDGVQPLVVPRVANGVAILTYSLPAGTDRNSRGVGWDIMVPPSVSVSIATSNGSATVIGVQGDVTVATSNAPIDASGLGDGKASFTTTNGDIDARFTGAPATVKADTSNANVSVITDGRTQYFDRTDTTNGTVERKNLGADDYTLAPGRMIDVRTSNGNITIH
jgi:hypothetical protein